MRRNMFLMSLVTLIGLGILCTSETAQPTPPKSPPAATISTSPKASWESTWEEVAREARKEASVVIVTNLGSEVTSAITRAMREKYGIAAEFITGRGNEAAQKVSSERKAGLYLKDAYLGGLNSAYSVYRQQGFLDNMDKVLILPEVLKGDAWFQGTVPWVDKEHTILGYVARVQQPIAVNTKVATPEEITAWRDLLAPKWKGKIILDDPSVTGKGSAVLGVALVVLGMDYVRAFAKQEPIITRDRQFLGISVAQGKYPIGVGMDDAIGTRLRQARAPIKLVVPIDGAHVTAGTGGVAVIKQAPHPNATKVLINWILSKDGQTQLSRITLNQSARADIPVDYLSPDYVRQEGVKYFNSGAEEYLLKGNEQLKTLKKIFASQLGG